MSSSILFRAIASSAIQYSARFVSCRSTASWARTTSSTARWIVIAVLGLAILYLTLQLPFFAQAKAFYGLCMAGPLALFFAVGVVRCDDALASPRALPARIAFHAWWFLTASVLFLSFAG